MSMAATTGFRKLQACFHDPEHPSWVIVQALVGVLVVVSIGLLVAELAWEDDVAILQELEYIDDVVLWIFVVELALRVITFVPPELSFYRAGVLSRLRGHVFGRLRFLLQPLNLADALAVLAVIPALRGLRALRLLRLLRGMKLFRYASPLAGLARSFADNRLPFVLAFSFLSLTVVMFGTTIYMVEHRFNDSVETLADGYWWAIVTLTTVGFGDIAPVTAVGRAIAAILMVIGMFTLALFAGIVGHTLLGVIMTIRSEEFRMGGELNHLVVCGYDPEGRQLLRELVAEVGRTFEGRLVVFAPGDRPADLPHEFAWVAGNPTKESELGKVRMGHAAVAIIVGSRAVSPAQADAITILTAFTIRSFMHKVDVAAARARPLYVIAEVLDSENVAHARDAGCDEVIETTRLGFSLLAHATSMPGTAEVLSKVAARGAQSLYVGEPEPGPWLDRTFGELVEHFKSVSDILVIGVRDAQTGAHRLNPPMDYRLRSGEQLLYLAERAVLSRSENPRRPRE